MRLVFCVSVFLVVGLLGCWAHQGATEVATVKPVVDAAVVNVHPTTTTTTEIGGDGNTIKSVYSDPVISIAVLVCGSALTLLLINQFWKRRKLKPEHKGVVSAFPSMG